jgi:hypothetical protein
MRKFWSLISWIYTLTSPLRSVELIVAVSGTSTSWGYACLSHAQIIALVKCELTVVQSSCESLFLRYSATVFLQTWKGFLSEQRGHLSGIVKEKLTSVYLGI